eukprot:CAMPEP_0197889454 /NCGR_PEP_ID=MMETSP1439-20131203/24350_1 /TAXON_ID=66791 /ORGANISM="Gonyaulax spinifera, Strain CCMP409" /LENGTH=46 /DNA_ID= /DNA_START= /DNA_END= /DNA_ORIENTATION=
MAVQLSSENRGFAALKSLMRDSTAALPRLASMPVFLEDSSARAVQD